GASRVGLEQLQRASAEPLAAEALLDEEVVHVGAVCAARRPEHATRGLARGGVLHHGGALIRLAHAVRKQRCEVSACLPHRRLRGHPDVVDETAGVLGVQRGEKLLELVVAQRPKPNVHGYVWIWYFDTQSSIVDQSRLSKNASMYDARSVW